MSARTLGLNTYLCNMFAFFPNFVLHFIFFVRADYLIGVDLSEGMLDAALERSESLFP